MKVEIVENGLMVVPETDFEKDWLVNTFFSLADDIDIIAFLKDGAEANDLRGLKVAREPKKIK